MSLTLQDLRRCFQGVLPSPLATCSADGTPNVTYLSQVHLVDARHVALSCQFFNKTRRNVQQNPFAAVEVHDPVTFETYRLQLRFDHAETEGPLFETMSTRIDAIAAHTGMTGVFELIAADVYEVLSIEHVAGLIAPPPAGTLDTFGVPSTSGPLGELGALHALSDRIIRARSLDELIGVTLSALDELFGFAHSMLLVPDESGTRLVTLATHGYGERGVGAEVAIGVGLIGTVAKTRRVLRMAVGTEMRYGRAIRERVEETDAEVKLSPEIPLPGLPNAENKLVLPLVVEDRLAGVLAIESTKPGAFEEWHEAFLGIVANQIAAGLDRLMQDEDEDEAEPSPPPPAAPAGQGRPKKTFWFYRNDDCVFVDGEYLIRNVPGKILWKLLNAHATEGRTDFTNRELRLDPCLGLPAIKDNLESRLILLRKRLEQKCPEVRLVPTGRGRFALELTTPIDLIEKAEAS